VKPLVRWLILGVLIAAPILACAAVGAWALWRSGSYFWFWWAVPTCWGVAFLLARRWRRPLIHQPASDLAPPLHWTAQDQEAWRLVQAQQQAAAELSPERLTDPHFYLQSAIDLSLAIARHYHPQTQDPVGSLTVPDILAAAQLAIEDSAQWVSEYVPGSHLLTVNQWRTLAKTPRWLSKAGDVTWVVSVLLDPLSIVRYLASRWTVGSASREMRDSALTWFYMAFLRYAGFYLIEMNSGRLRGGAAGYQALRARLARRDTPAAPATPVDAPAASATTEPAATEPIEVTVTLVGQVKAGKSSVANALLGQQQAEVDVLPQTRTVTRYTLRLPEAPERLILLDTPGYSDEALAEEAWRDTVAALERSDIVLLVVHAAHPARRADRQVLERLAQALAARPRLKPPPVLVVLTHIDLLSPLTEWQPPYDWQHPSGAKAQNIHDAVRFNADTFGTLASGVVPVCSDVARGRSYGVSEWLLPAIVSLLGQAQAVALLRALHAELDAGHVRRVLKQLSQAGAGLLRTLTSRDKLDLSRPPWPGE
jgi:small GTP-binding protein